MKIDTYGNPNIYGTLEYITKKINKLPKKDKRKLSAFIIKFNTICKEIENLNSKIIIFDLIKADYKSKLNKFDKLYEEDLMTSLRNFIYTKIKILKKS